MLCSVPVCSSLFNEALSWSGLFWLCLLTLTPTWRPLCRWAEAAWPRTAASTARLRRQIQGTRRQERPTKGAGATAAAGAAATAGRWRRWTGARRPAQPDCWCVYTLTRVAALLRIPACLRASVGSCADMLLCYCAVTERRRVQAQEHEGQAESQSGWRSWRPHAGDYERREA